MKSAEEYDAGIQLDELFNVLRKYEYENIIKNHYGELPNVSAFHYAGRIPPNPTCGCTELESKATNQ